MRKQPQPRSLEQIIDEIFKKEGHRSNDSDDLGGDTTWGITEATARKYGYSGAMSELSQELAREIYAKRYIHNPKFSDIHAISPIIGEEVIDTGINMGKHIAARFLQRWLNAYNNKQSLYPDLVVDGLVGQATIQALTAFLKHRGSEGEMVLWMSLNCSQGARYLEISEARERNEKYTYGWMKNRVYNG